MEIVELGVSDMHCGSCVQQIEAAVLALPGVEAVEARIGSVRVEYYAEAVTRAQIAGAIEAAGYPVAGESGGEGGRRGFLARMARTNEELFGHRRLDCCTLNRPAPARPSGRHGTV